MSITGKASGTGLMSNLKSLGLIGLNMLIAMAIGSIFIIIQGQNPLEVYYYLLVEPLTRTSGIIKVLGKATPLILSGLAAVIAFRCSLFNVGIEGQIYIGGLAAAVAALYFPINNAFIKIPVCLLFAMVTAGLWSMLAGWLKVKFKVHEVLSTIMMNYIAMAMVSYILLTFMKSDGISPRTNDFPVEGTLPQLFPPEHLNLGFIIAIGVAVLMYVVFNYMPFGWNIDAAGKNMLATKYSGISSSKVILLVMLISGMIGGLVGAERVMGAYGYMELSFSPGYGYDGMTVAIIGRNSPIGAVVMGLFIGLLHYGGVNINMYTSVSTEWVYALIAIMLILVVADKGIFNSISALFKRKERL